MSLLVVNAIFPKKPEKYSIKTDTSAPTVWRAMDLSPGPWKGAGSLGPSSWWKFVFPIMSAEQILLPGSIIARRVF